MRHDDLFCNRLPGSVLAALVALAMACSSAPKPDTGLDSAASATASKGYNEVIEGFFAEYFKRWPVLASRSGEHSHDGKWPDLSPAGRAERQQWLAALGDRIAAIPTDSLTLDQRVDLEIIADRIRLARLVQEIEKPYETNPLAYTFLIGPGLDGLVDRDYAPMAIRAAALAERLESLPALIDQAIANMADASAVKAPQARVAVGQMAGIASIINERIPERIAGAPADVVAKVNAASPAALAAIEKLGTHLTAVVPQARGSWRLGKEAFAKKLALTLQTGMSADDVHQRARAEHDRVRARMDAMARELHQPLFGDPAPPGVPDSVDDALIRKVLNALAEEHVSAEELRDACAENLDRLNAFVRQANIVPMDDSEVLEVIWTPPHRRGVAVAGLDSPPPLDAKEGLPSYYIVQPVPPQWPEERRVSLLREYNHFMLEILSIHEAIPGHFVQLYYSRRNPSKVRKVFANGTFVEGWAVYTEKVMVDAGYVGKPYTGAPPTEKFGLSVIKADDTLRAKAIALHGLKFYLRAVTNAIIDHEIHAGTMTEDQAVSLMMDRSFQEEGEARGKWIRAQVSSTQLSSYFVGANVWFELRRQAEERASSAGTSFDMATFHREALSHGSPPLSQLPALLGW